jgi:hypothetical protein
MNPQIQSIIKPVSMTEEVLFQFQHLEITPTTLVIRFLEKETVILLKEIASYHLKWYLHDPTSATKYWFLVLTAELMDGRAESGPIAVAEFSYADDEREPREIIAGNIAEIIDLALSWHHVVSQKFNGSKREPPNVTKSAADQSLMILATHFSRS